MNAVSALAKGVKPLAGELLAATSLEMANFFGFYDICPFSPDDREIVHLSCPGDFLRMPAGEKALVRVWTPETGQYRTVGETIGWNWQHGARQRWLKDGSILFNDVEDGRQVARIVTAAGEAVRTLDSAVGALNPQETLGVAGNYARLAKLYETYGYAAASNAHIGAGAEDDGLWSIDIASGSARVLLSYARLCADLGITYSDGLFVTHPDFSPSGDQVAFFLIENGHAGTSTMRLLVYTFSTDTVILVTGEKASHPAWISDTELWTWARESAALKMLTRGKFLSYPGVSLLVRFARKFRGVARNALLSEGFFIYRLGKESGKTRIATSLLTEDGHYSKHPTANVMLGDTYPDDSNYLTLLVYSL
ncbi:MAG: hypothetical protein EOP58_15515, partial [Sphingomonadales bacterium]